MNILDAFFAIFILVTLVFYPRVSKAPALIDSNTGKYSLQHGYRYKILSLVFALYAPIIIVLFFYPSHAPDTIDLIMFYVLLAVWIFVGTSALIGAFRHRVQFTEENITARYQLTCSPVLLWQNITRINYLHRRRVLQLSQNDGQYVRVSVYLQGLSTLLNVARQQCPSAIDDVFEQWLRKNKFAP